MRLETTATRLWKRLPPEERLLAATCFWREPSAELVGGAVAAIVKARRIRPQVVRALPLKTQARTLASILEPGETLAAALLVALHLGGRRRMLTTFLDALGLPHEDGILKEDAATPPPIPEEAARNGVRALLAAFPRPEVQTYLNTLWLQDPERWAVLSKDPEWV